MIVSLALFGLAAASDQLAQYSLPPARPLLAACADQRCAPPADARSYRVAADEVQAPSAKDRALSAQSVACGITDRRCAKRGRRILTLGLPD